MEKDDKLKALAKLRKLESYILDKEKHKEKNKIWTISPTKKYREEN